MSRQVEAPLVHLATPPVDAIGPVSVEQTVEWAGFKLTGASPDELATAEDLEEMEHRFDVVLEALWQPQVNALIMDLSSIYDEDHGTSSLEASILVGKLYDAEVKGEGGAPSIARLAESELTAPPSPYEVAACDPGEVLGRRLEHCRLLLPGSISVSSGGTTCSTLLHFRGSGRPWLTLAAALTEWKATVRVRTSLLSWSPDREHRGKVEEQLKQALEIVEASQTSAGPRFEAQRVAQATRTLLDDFDAPVFMAEVAICGDRPLDQALLQRIAAEVAGEGPRDRYASYQRFATADRAFGLSLTPPARYRMEPAPDDWQEAAAIGLPTRALSGGARVADLFPLKAARSAFQWPIPWRGPVPSIATTRFRALEARQAESEEGVGVGTDAAGGTVRIDPAARTRHMHVVGVPGSGKTTLLSSLVHHDLKSGGGFVAIDPHGDLAGRVRSGADSSADFVEFGVEDPAGPKICLLPASRNADDPAEVERAVGRLVEAVSSHLPEEWVGPRFRSIAKAALTVLSYCAPGEPLSATAEMLYDESHLRMLLTDYEGPDWAKTTLVNLHKNREKADVASWAASKFEDLFTSELSKRLVGAVGEGTEITSFVKDNARAVISLDRSALSALEAGLLGHVVLAGCIDAAFDRGIGTGDLFSLYVDEIHAFPARNLAKGLSEGRKFGLGLVLAHQHLGQLDPPVRDALVGHCGVDFLFRLSPPDAQFYSSLLAIPVSSLRDQPDLHAFVRQSVRGKTSPPFSLWLPAPQGGKAW